MHWAATRGANAGPGSQEMERLPLIPGVVREGELGRCPSPVLLSILSLLGEPPHSCCVLGVLGIPTGLQLHLGAHGLWGRCHHHPHWGPHLLPGSVLEKQTKVCAQTHG